MICVFGVDKMAVGRGCTSASPVSYSINCTILTASLNNVLETNSQETHYASATKINCLMLFRETVAVIVRTIRKIHPVCRMQSFCMLKQVVHVESLGLKGLRKY
jgi:hypothetical protein